MNESHLERKQCVLRLTLVTLVGVYQLQITFINTSIPALPNSVFPCLSDIDRHNHWLSLLTWLLPLSCPCIYIPLSDFPSRFLPRYSGASCFPPSRDYIGSIGGALLFKGDPLHLFHLYRHATSVWGVRQTSQVHWVRTGSPDLNELYIRNRLNRTPAKTWFWIQVVNAAVTTINIRPAGEKLCWSLLKMETWI